ncbi:uncharacterized protein LOC144132558 [Amblyomma americanum]
MARLSEIVAFALLCAVALGQQYTKDFYEESQYRPVLTYECYRTGVTLEPEGTVNFTILWDGTEPGNDKAEATMWYSPNGTVDQYASSTFVFEFDEATSTIKINSSDVEEHFIQLIEPYNDLAYYLNITITSQNNRVVYKLYDVDSSCGNAAAVRGVVDPQGAIGFVFSRDVPEPTESCAKDSLCAP